MPRFRFGRSADGSGAEPPRDITAWMSDRVLGNPDLRALDVNVLVHRSDLDTLTAKLEALMDAYRAMDVTGQSWFQNLRTLPTLAAVDQLQCLHRGRIEHHGVVGGQALQSCEMAQAVALRGEHSVRPPVLAATYHLTLTSDWPSNGDTEGCGNPW